MEIALKIAELENKNLKELQALWSDYFQTECDSSNKEFYVSRIAYRMQELSLGGLSQATKKLIAGLYVDKKNKKYHPPLGTRLVREYQGIEHSIKVWSDGFEYNGMKYKTLSSIATKITGKKISGRHFFGLDKE